MGIMEERRDSIYLKKKFDKANLPMTFYAHTLQFINRNCYDKRCAVKFEAVPKDEIQMFIEEELPEKLTGIAGESKNFSVAWDSFQKGGMNSAEFTANKGKYLLEVRNAQIWLMFHSYARAKSIVNSQSDWWEITINESPASEEDDACLFQIFGQEAAEEEFTFEVKPVPSEQAEKIDHLFIGDSGSDAEELQGNDLIFLENITYKKIYVYYVGAALCCALIDDNGDTAVFFDMGQENYYAQRKLSTKNMNNCILLLNAAQRSISEIMEEAKKAKTVYVIISHWHDDHCEILHNLAEYCNSSGEYEDFFEKTIVIGPEVIDANNFGPATDPEDAKEEKQGWSFLHYSYIAAFYKTNLPNNFIKIENDLKQDRCEVIGDSPNLALFKIDYKINGNCHHPHDHGICAKVRLESGHTVLLTGDCHYDAIGTKNTSAPLLTNDDAGYDSLVATHHGGRYTHTKALERDAFIPQPKFEMVSRAYFSANGVAYGHPDKDNVNDHIDRGWIPKGTLSRPEYGENKWIIT